MSLHGANLPYILCAEQEFEEFVEPSADDWRFLVESLLLLTAWNSISGRFLLGL